MAVRASMPVCMVPCIAVMAFSVEAVTEAIPVSIVPESVPMAAETSAFHSCVPLEIAACAVPMVSVIVSEKAVMESETPDCMTESVSVTPLDISVRPLCIFAPMSAHEVSVAADTSVQHWSKAPVTVAVRSDTVPVMVPAPALIPSAIAPMVSREAFAAVVAASPMPLSMPVVIPSVIALPEARAAAFTSGRFPVIAELSVVATVSPNPLIAPPSDSVPASTPLDIPSASAMPAAAASSAMPGTAAAKLPEKPTAAIFPLAVAAAVRAGLPAVIPLAAASAAFLPPPEKRPTTLSQIPEPIPFTASNAAPPKLNRPEIML